MSQVIRLIHQLVLNVHQSGIDPEGNDHPLRDDADEKRAADRNPETSNRPADVDSKLGTVKRPDGELQVTYAGFGLYRYSGDRKAGDVKGQGFQRIWYAISPSGKVVTTTAGGGGYGGGYGR